MQINPNQEPLKDLLEKSKRILILTRENPSPEVLASMLAFYQQFSPEKEIFLAAKAVSANLESLGETDKINNQLPARNLVISFDYIEGMIDKVSYNVEGNKFNLIISPRSGAISPEKVEYHYAGGGYDLLIVLNTPNVESLGSIIERENYLFDLPSVNIDNNLNNQNFAKLNIIDSQASSISEMVISILVSFSYPLKPKAAQALLFGLRSATANFTQNVNERTFEAAAFCMKFLEKSQEEVPPAASSQEQTLEQTQSGGEEKAPDESWLAPKIFRSSRTLD